MATMLAIAPKVEKRAVEAESYLNEAMNLMTIDGDEHGYFCEVPSEEDSGFRYRVRFVEPDGKTPYATGCECIHRRTHPALDCKHMEIVNAYYAWIYSLMDAPICDTPESQPGDMSIAEHLLEEELDRYHKDLLFEAAHGVSSLRMRAKDAGLTGLSRAGKDQLIGSLMAYRRHTLVRDMSPGMTDDAHKMPTKCQQKELTRGEIVVILRECLGVLLSVCDGAIQPDGHGCNGADAGHLRWMYRKQDWKSHEVIDVAERLQKYNLTQLSGQVPALAIVEKIFAESANLNGSNQGFNLMR